MKKRVRFRFCFVWDIGCILSFRLENVVYQLASRLHASSYKVGFIVIKNAEKYLY